MTQACAPQAPPPQPHFPLPRRRSNVVPGPAHTTGRDAPLRTQIRCSLVLVLNLIGQASRRQLAGPGPSCQLAPVFPGLGPPVLQPGAPACPRSMKRGGFCRERLPFRRLPPHGMALTSVAPRSGPLCSAREKAKRRCPRRYRYSGTACPQFRRVRVIGGVDVPTWCVCVCVCVLEVE